MTIEGLNDPHLVTALIVAESEYIRASHRLASTRETLNTFAPINHFPDEILAEIFRWCLPELRFSQDEHVLMTAPVKRVTPLLFSGICRRWRRIAITTPVLWRNVELYVSIRRYKSQTSVLENWLIYSGDLSLTILVNVCAQEDLKYWSRYPPVKIAELLSQHSARWHIAYVAIPINAFSEIPSVPFPRLASLTFRTSSYRNAVTNMFATADQIRSIEFLSTAPGYFTFPKGKIQILRAHYVPAQDCYRVMCLSPELVDCHLESPYLKPDVAFPEILVMQQLERLYVTQYPHESIGLFLDAITVPSVRSFEFGAQAHEVPHAQIISMIQRSGCLLKSLVLRFIEMDDTDLMAILRLTPAVTEFRILIMGIDQGRTTTNRLLHTLTPLHSSLEGRACLLPCLEFLEFEAPYIYDEEAMVDMLASRWRKAGYVDGNLICAKLQRVYLGNNGTTIHSTITEQLQKLIDEGMEIEMSRMTFAPPFEIFVDD
ncbi:hypothetical protein AMATHDRAFT_47583 [Amanita thiersii Skay4041]|uniref:Uncharacterized protein n=1 Tax=Amanita thiersii Skay4041 TaxID=703135 RepID=A0A2A9NR80_9AGAR|nr:hypothetical protein AMATHDRAFT_47583 [Amanita thiersii Skay4041]